MMSSFLKNKYWVLRHGKSIPNEKGIIVSSMENGTLDEYKLACEGVTQAQLAGEMFLKVCSIGCQPCDPLQILQTILNASIDDDDKGSINNDLTSRMHVVKEPSIISLHRKFALLTGELRAVA